VCAVDSPEGPPDSDPPTILSAAAVRRHPASAEASRVAVLYSRTRLDLRGYAGGSTRLDHSPSYCPPATTGNWCAPAPPSRYLPHRPRPHPAHPTHNAAALYRAGCVQLRVPTSQAVAAALL
jgi:hypothetical protein